MATEFWSLSSPESAAHLAEWDHDQMDLEGITCSLNPGHQRAGKRLTDLNIVLPRKRVDDFVWTWQSECMVQDHVLRLFREHALTGFEVKPVKARFKRRSEERPPNLREIVVTGGAGVAPEESGVRLVEECPGCGYSKYTDPKSYSLIISEDQWDGSDFFRVRPFGFLFVTNTVRELIREYGFTGARLAPPKALDAQYKDILE